LEAFAEFLAKWWVASGAAAEQPRWRHLEKSLDLGTGGKDTNRDTQDQTEEEKERQCAERLIGEPATGQTRSQAQGIQQP
jgi:hypothetical protein